MKWNKLVYLVLMVFIISSCDKDTQTYEPKKLFMSPKGGIINTSNITLIYEEGTVDHLTEIKVNNWDTLWYIDGRPNLNDNSKDSMYFFRDIFYITPEDLQFKKPVNIIVGIEQNWLKIFDDDYEEVSFKLDELKLCEVHSDGIFTFGDDPKNFLIEGYSGLECPTNLEFKNESVYLNATINHSGNYGIGINRKYINFWGGYYKMDISGEEYDNQINFEEEIYSNSSRSFITTKKMAFANLDLTNIIIRQADNSESFYLKTNVPNKVGSHDFYWDDYSFNSLEINRGSDGDIIYYNNEVRINPIYTIIGRDEGPSNITYTKFEDIGGIVEGTLTCKGTLLSDFFITAFDHKKVDINITFSIRRR